MTGPSEITVRIAYGEIAIERGLTYANDADGLPIVPPHWREAATRRAEEMVSR